MIPGFFLFIIYAISSGMGLILLKLAMNNNRISFDNLSGSFFNLAFMSGFALYIIGFLSWLFILSKFKLNVAFPIAVSLFFVVSGLGSSFILKESFTTQQIAGILLCFLGIILISIK